MMAGRAVRRLMLMAALMAPAAAAEPELPERIDAAMTAGDYAAARPLAEEWLKALEDKPGQKLEIARVRHVLGSIRDRLGDHGEALKLLESAAADYESSKASGEEMAACADEAGRAALGAGEFAAAERWLTRAITGRQGTMASISRSALGEALLKTGRAEEARREWEHALTDAGASDEARCFALRGLGIHAHTTGAWDAAVKQFRAAREAAKALGTDAPAMMAALDGQTGQSLLRAGRAAEATPLLESAAAWFQTHGGSSDEKAAAWNNVAALWLDSGQSARAAERLSVLLESPASGAFASTPQAITPWLNLAAARQRTGDAAAKDSLTTAGKLAAKHLPAVHPLRIQIALTATAIAADAGDRASAKRFAVEASQHAVRWMEQAAAWPDESRLLEFHATLDAVSPVAAFAAETPDPVAAAVLATQGAVPEILLGRRRWESRAAKEAVFAWKRDPDHAPGPPARKVPGVEELRAGLPADALLVNFVRWRPYQGRGVWDAEGRYGALLVSRGEATRWVDLGPAPVIESRLRRIIAACRDAVAAGAESTGRASIPWQLSNLFGMLWSPLGVSPDKTKRILLRADALLHFVPWAALTDRSGLTLCEAYPDLEIIVFPRAAAAPSATQRWRVLAAAKPPSTGLPDFTDALPPLLSPSLLQSLEEMPALPGVAAEVAAIRQAAGGAIAVETPEANEAAFALNNKKDDAPSVIHFAGHGFVCEEDGENGPFLLWAGLVMSDCAGGLRDFVSGHPRPPSSDGLLFSADAAALPLAGVSTVVLSGCQTGLGHWQTGGQLAGLRHAFLIAGAGTVASTLWDLNDAAAPVMVKGIYRQLAAGSAPSLAVWRAQREWLTSPEARKLTAGMRAAQAGAWTGESGGWRP
jgi:tetratricopeptide (TPR) repeat protein